jgi:hypothetical protein
MLYVTPLSNENEVTETGPAVQVNAVKFPSKSALTNIYKVGWGEGREDSMQEVHFLSQPSLPSAVQATHGNSSLGLSTCNLIDCSGNV